MRDIGLPPKHWMKLERMVVARRKLEGGKSPDQVSRDLGFMSVHTFNRQFQQFYQTTPGRFQEARRLFDPSRWDQFPDENRSGSRDFGNRAGR